MELQNLIMALIAVSIALTPVIYLTIFANPFAPPNLKAAAEEHPLGVGTNRSAEVMGMLNETQLDTSSGDLMGGMDFYYLLLGNILTLILKIVNLAFGIVHDIVMLVPNLLYLLLPVEIRSVVESSGALAVIIGLLSVGLILALIIKVTGR